MISAVSSRRRRGVPRGKDLPDPLPCTAVAAILAIETREARQCLDITHHVSEVVRGSGVEAGLCQLTVLGATAAIVINENDDPNIGVDLLNALERAIPDHAGWLHDEIDNNAQAHIKAAILGPSETLIIEDGDLLLGKWQGIILVEFDGPRRHRRVAVELIENRAG